MITIFAMTALETATIIKVANGLTSDVMPNPTLEGITIGNVLCPGPDTKLAITRLSSDKVNDNNQQR